MKIVMDTNVIISAIAFGGIPREILELIFNREVYNYISDDILDEIKEVLQRPKFNYDALKIKFIIHELEQISEYMEPIKINEAKSQIQSTVRDQDDNCIIAMAIAGACDYLVTGDDDLLILQEVNQIKIVTPREFMQKLSAGS